MSSTGKCTAWLPHKGFGFIEETAPEKRSVFCHQSNLKSVEGGFRALHPGQEVQFDVELLNGKHNALNVTEVGGGILASCTYRGRGRGGRGGGFRGGDRGGYAPRGGGGYAPRGGYHNGPEGGYAPRGGGGYAPRGFGAPRGGFRGGPPRGGFGGAPGGAPRGGGFGGQAPAY